MVSNATSTITYNGNASTVTGYSVAFDYLSASHIKVAVTAKGTGTVSVVDGLATFSSAQATLEAGARIRIDGNIHIIQSRTSDTVFTFQDRPDYSSENFWLIDDEVVLSGGQYTVVEVGAGAPYVTTGTAYPNTSLVRVYRVVPYTQLLDLQNVSAIDVRDIEQALDLAVQQIQQLAAGDGYINSQTSASATVNGVQFWATSTVRNAAVPDYVGQPGTQLDTRVSYVSTGLSAGNWAATATSSNKVFASSAAIPTTTADFVGQTGYITGSPLQAGEPARTGTFRAYGTSAGNFYEVIPRYGYGIWQALPFAPTEPLELGVRQAGAISGINRWLETASIAFMERGIGDLTFKVWVKSQNGTRREVFTGTVPMGTGGYSGSVAFVGVETGININSALKFGSDGITWDEVLEVEILSMGNPITLDTIAGDEVSTPDTGDLPTLLTGVPVTTPDHGDNVLVIGVRQNGDVVLSHPAQDTANQDASAGIRKGVVGVTGLTLAAGDTTITVPPNTATLIKGGDVVLGASAAPGTTVVAVDEGTGVITVNIALVGPGTVVGFTGPTKVKLHNFLNMTILSGVSSITLPTTTDIKVGDTVIDPDGEIPDGAYITVVANPNITISAATTDTVSRLHIVPPIKVVSGTAGTTSLTATVATGIRIGARIVGPVPGEAYVTGVSGATFSTSIPLDTDLSGDTVQLARDKIYINADLTANSTTIVLPYAVSSTEVAVGMTVQHKDIPTGTTVVSMAGSNVVLSAAPKANVVAADIFMLAYPEWKGMALSLAGLYNNQTPE